MSELTLRGLVKAVECEYDHEPVVRAVLLAVADWLEDRPLTNQTHRELRRIAQEARDDG